MKILLIAPPLFKRKNRKIKPRFPPYLIVSVATQLKKAGFDIQIYDAFLEGDGIQEVMQHINSQKPDLIGIFPADVIRFVPVQINIEITKLIKTYLPDTLVAILGLRTDKAIKYLLENVSGIDYILLGDPEETMVELARRINNNEETNNIGGIIKMDTRGNDSVKSNPSIAYNLDKLDFPSWNLIDLSRYHFVPHRYRFGRPFPILTTRGCPWDNCIFCKESSIINLPPYRTRSAENVVDEIELITRKYNFSEMQFFEGNFNTDIEWLKRFRDEIKKRKLSFTWSCLSRVDMIQEKAAKIMRDAGCWNIVFGIESNSQVLLDVMNKGIRVENIREAIRICKSQGIETTGNFLIGIPGERPIDVINSARFAVDLGLDYAAFFITKWHDICENFISKGRLTEKWDYPQFDFVGPVFIPEGYNGLGHLKRIQRKAYLTFYLHPSTILRCLKKVKCIKDFKRLALAFIVFIKIAMERVSFSADLNV